MKRLFVPFVAMSLLVLGTHASAEELAVKPTFKDGDTWQFNVTRSNQVSTAQLLGIYELNYTHGNVRAFSVEGLKKNEIHLDPKSIDPSIHQILNWLGLGDQQLILKFPLTVGQKWTYKYENRPPGRQSAQRRSAEVSVIGIEQVETPAGTFRAFKLVREETSNSISHNSILYFYSPDTNSIIKSSSQNMGGGTTETELIKFTPGN